MWLADFLTKKWALEYLPGKDIQVVGEWLQLQLSFNTGAAFGLGANGGGILLSIFAISASCMVVYYAPFLTSKAWAIAFAMVLGGAIGNVTDRAFNFPGFFRGPVTDWIKLPNWPNFNLADSFIVIAAVLAFILTAKNINPIERNQINNQINDQISKDAEGPDREGLA
ncbi:MAG: signal peptidase II [Candidatus Nanopelagicaceae bacterium]